MKTKVLLLARVAGGNSQKFEQLEDVYASQERQMREHCEKNNYDAVHYVKCVGSRFPMELIIKKHNEMPFEKLIVFRLDRLGRNRVDVTVVKNQLRQMGVEIESATESGGESIIDLLVECGKLFCGECGERITAVKGGVRNATSTIDNY